MLLKNKIETAFREIGGFFVSFFLIIFRSYFQLFVTIFVVLKKNNKGFPLLSGLGLSFSKQLSIPLESQFIFGFRSQIHRLRRRNKTLLELK
jgi:hypothetical protein